MAKTKVGSKNVTLRSGEEIRQLTGPVTDHTIAEIVGLNATVEDLEVTMSFIQGQGDIVDRIGHPLSGNAGRIYEILQQDELYQNNDER